MFKFAIISAFLLDRVVCQVDKFIGQVFQIVLFAGGSNIPVLIPVAFDYSIHSCHEDETTYVKFPLVEEKGLLHVLLDDYRAPVLASLSHQAQDFGQII